jgi:exonuclease III
MFLKVLSRNVAGLNSQPRLHQVINMARSYDIICLHKTKISINQAPFIRAKWGSDHVFISSTGSASRGAITLFHQRTSPTHLYVHSNPQGKFIINVAVIKDELYAVINVYGHPDTDAAALTTMSSIHDQLQHIHQNFQIQHCIMGGDFNFVLQPSDTLSTSSKPRAEDMCPTIITALDLFDLAALTSNNPGHTYFRHRREMKRSDVTV